MERRKGVKSRKINFPFLIYYYKSSIALSFKGVTQDEELTNRKILNFAER